MSSDEFTLRIMIGQDDPQLEEEDRECRCAAYDTAEKELTAYRKGWDDAMDSMRDWINSR